MIAMTCTATTGRSVEVLEKGTRVRYISLDRQAVESVETGHIEGWRFLGDLFDAYVIDGRLVAPGNIVHAQ